MSLPATCPKSVLKCWKATVSLRLPLHVCRCSNMNGPIARWGTPTYTLLSPTPAFLYHDLGPPISRPYIRVKPLKMNFSAFSDGELLWEGLLRQKRRVDLASYSPLDPYAQAAKLRPLLIAVFVWESFLRINIQVNFGLTLPFLILSPTPRPIAVRHHSAIPLPVNDLFEKGTSAS